MELWCRMAYVEPAKQEHQSFFGQCLRRIVSFVCLTLLFVAVVVVAAWVEMVVIAGIVVVDTQYYCHSLAWMYYGGEEVEFLMD